jgi:hypothetical protein
MSRARRLGRLLACLPICVLASPLGSIHAARAQEPLLPLTVELGDVSLTKLPFVMAAEAGIYRRNGLDVKQFITPNAAELIRRGAGLVVPKEFVGTGAGDINIGGGSPTLVRMTADARAPQRVVLATTDDVSRFHIVSRQDLASPQDLKGKRIGFSGVGALSHYVTILFAQRLGWDYRADLSLFANGVGADLLRSGRRSRGWRRTTKPRHASSNPPSRRSRCSRPTSPPPSPPWRNGMASPIRCGRPRSMPRRRSCRARPIRRSRASRR